MNLLKKTILYTKKTQRVADFTMFGWILVTFLQNDLHPLKPKHGIVQSRIYTLRFQTSEHRTLNITLFSAKLTQRDPNPWPPQYQCDAVPSKLWSRSSASSIYTYYMKSEMMCMRYESYDYIWLYNYHSGREAPSLKMGSVLWVDFWSYADIDLLSHALF